MHEVKKSSVNYVKKNMDYAVKTDLIINFKKILNWISLGTQLQQETVLSH